MIKKILIGTAVLAISGLTGCVVVPARGVYVGPAIYGPPVVVGPPVVFGWCGGGGYGWHRGYCR